MKQKTSQARVIPIRANPIHEEDAKFLKIIDDNEAIGISRKATIVDAVLRANGCTPEMFSNSQDTNTSAILRRIEDMLHEFADSIISRVESGEITPNNIREEVGKEDYSPGLMNFLNGVNKKG